MPNIIRIIVCFDGSAQTTLLRVPLTLCLSLYMVISIEWISCSYCRVSPKISPTRHPPPAPAESKSDEQISMEAFGLSNTFMAVPNTNSKSVAIDMPSRRKSMDVQSSRASRMNSQVVPDNRTETMKNYVQAFTGSQLSTDHESILKEPPLDFCKYLVSLSKDPQSSTEINTRRSDSLQSEKKYSTAEFKNLGSVATRSSEDSTSSIPNARNIQSSFGLQESIQRPKSILRRPSVGGAVPPCAIAFNQDFGRSTRRQSIMGAVISPISRGSDHQSLGSEIDNFMQNQLAEMEKQLKERLKIRQFRKGEFIIRKEEIGTEMYFIATGKVEVVSGNGQVRYSIIEEGAVFGELGVFFDMPRTASVRALENCVCSVLSRDDFNQVKTKFPVIQERFQKVVTQRLDEINRQGRLKKKGIRFEVLEETENNE